MVESSVITDEIRNMIGEELATQVFEVEKGMIRKIAQAVEDPNPLWQDEEYARKSRYGGIIAPPSIIWAIVPETLDYYAVGFKFPLMKLLNAGFEQECYQPVRPGDVLTATLRLADVQEKKGKLGQMVFFHYEVSYTNQNGDPVMKLRQSFIRY